MNMDDYVPVNERIQAFYAKFPDGSIQPLWLDQPWRVLGEGETKWLVYAAAAYRTPDDARPGIGVCWEPVPGKTPYTRGSELMVAETSAIGRALANLGFLVNKSVASADEIRSARERSGAPQTARTPSRGSSPQPKARTPQGGSQDVTEDAEW